MADLLFDPGPLIAWCREEKMVLKRQIEMLVGGDMKTRSQTFGQDDRDTTQQALDEARCRLAELEQLLANSEPATFQRQVS